MGRLFISIPANGRVTQLLALRLLGGKHERVHRDFIGCPPLRCCCGFLNAFCSGTDYIDHHFRVGEHDDMAAGASVTLAPMRLALTFKSEEAFTVRQYGAVVLGDDVAAWLRLPGSSPGAGWPTLCLISDWNHPSEANPTLRAFRRVRISSVEILVKWPTHPNFT